MTYDPNIPQASDVISQSQAELLTNFQQLNLVYGDGNPGADPNSDHYPYDDTSANARKHRKVRLPDTSGTPYTPLASEGVMYARTDGSGNTYPFWRRDTSVIDYPILPIKAYASVITRTTNGACTLVTSMNVTSVTRSGLGAYDVVLAITLPFTAGVNEYAALFGQGGVPSSSSVIAALENRAASTFSVQLRTGAGVGTDGGDRFYFAILQ